MIVSYARGWPIVWDPYSFLDRPHLYFVREYSFTERMMTAGIADEIAFEIIWELYEASDGRWDNIDAESVREETVFCEHGRPPGSWCPHCLGVG